MTRSDDEEPFMSDEFLDREDDDDIDEAEEECEQRRIVLHVYDDESKEFTSLTTYHGMVRIYNSNTWPSLIFWCLVVVTCVTLFMIHSGILLHFYLAHPTFQHQTFRNDDGTNFPTITVCQRPKSPYLRESQHNCLRKLTELRNVSECMEELDDFQRTYEAEHSRSLSLAEFLQNSEISSVRVVLNDVDVSGQVHRQRFLSKHGVCESLNVTHLLPLRQLSVVIENASAGVLYSLQNEPRVSHMDTDGLHARPGKRAYTAFRILKEQFLQKGDRGFCRPNADIPDCTEHCKARTYYSKCKCVPFYLKHLYGHLNECSLTQIQNCINHIDRPIEKCDCLVGCQRVNYRIVTSTYSRLPFPKRHQAIITVKQHSHLVEELLQLKRFKTVDLLSFVAGSMGLFLGMSCVTLMEIFMYLFKSVWGMVNNSRHKEFLENLLGESVENPIDESEGKLRRSHEQIVITVNGGNDNEIITFDHELLGNRRLSFVPLPRARLERPAMYNSKWELAVPPRLEITRSRASTLDSKFNSLDYNL